MQVQLTDECRNIISQKDFIKVPTQVVGEKPKTQRFHGWSYLILGRTSGTIEVGGSTRQLNQAFYVLKYPRYIAGLSA